MKIDNWIWLTWPWLSMSTIQMNQVSTYITNTIKLKTKESTREYFMASKNVEYMIMLSTWFAEVILKINNSEKCLSLNQSFLLKTYFARFLIIYIHIFLKPVFSNYGVKLYYSVFERRVVYLSGGKIPK